jgi:valyl-tRNA synthetase
LVIGPWSLLPADRALLSWLQRLIARATASYRAYDYAAAREATERFFWGTLCDNYLEWVKSRLYDGTPAERRAAQFALHHTLLATLKLFAPILPHVTEEIYQHLYDGPASGAPGEQDWGDAGSIHTSGWPRHDEALIDERAERAGAALLTVAGAARRFKSAHQLSLGAALARITIASADPELRAMLEQSQTDIGSVTRASQILFTDAGGTGFDEVASGLWMRIER